jgi:LysM repeat protein
MPGMTRGEPNLPDPPACPLLGLAADPRTRFTFAHPDHRCHATRRPSTTDLARQSRFCLSTSFADCERFRAFLPRPEKPMGAAAPPRAPSAPPRAPSAPSVVHVFRAGDSLTRIASAYGVTVDQLIEANHLAGAESVVDAQRLVIPLRRSEPGVTDESRSDQSG